LRSENRLIRDALSARSTALRGQPIRFSSVSAPDTDPDSIILEPDPRARAVDLFGASNLAKVSAGFDAETVAAYTAPKSAIPACILGPGRLDGR